MWFDWVGECEEVVVTSGEVWQEGGTARPRRGEDICDVIACQFESMDLMVMPLSTERSATVERIEAHDTSESEESKNDAEDQVQWVIRMWRKHGRAKGPGDDLSFSRVIDSDEQRKRKGVSPFKPVMSPSVICAKEKLGYDDVGREIDAISGSSNDEEKVVPVAPGCARFASECVASKLLMAEPSPGSVNCGETKTPAKKRRGKVQPVALFQSISIGGSNAEGAAEVEKKAAETVGAGNELIKAYKRSMAKDQNTSRMSDSLVIDAMVARGEGYLVHDTADAYHRMHLTKECQAPLDDDALVPLAKVSDADLASAKLKLEAVFDNHSRKGCRKFKPMQMKTGDAANATGSGSGGGSGCGGGNGFDNSEEGARRSGTSASLAMVDGGILRVIMDFLPRKSWCTTLPAVFTGAHDATFMKKREVGPGTWLWI